MYQAKQYSSATLKLMKQRTQSLPNDMIASFGYLLTHISLYENNYNIIKTNNLIRLLTTSKMLRSSSSHIVIDIRQCIYDYCITYAEQLLDAQPCGHLDVLMECAALLVPSNVKEIRQLAVELLNHMMKMIIIDIEPNMKNTELNTLFTFAPNTSHCRAYMRLHFVHATLFACIQFNQ
jgi:hypothetical protein